jgi:hypothetical protein
MHRKQREIGVRESLVLSAAYIALIRMSAVRQKRTFAPS